MYDMFTEDREMQFEEEEEEQPPVFNYNTEYYFLSTFNLFKGMTMTLTYDSSIPPPPWAPSGPYYFSSNLTWPEVVSQYMPFANALDQKYGKSLTIELIFINVNSQTALYQKLNFETDEYCN